MEPVEKFEHAGIDCAIYWDPDAGNPYREWDMASRVIVSPRVARSFDIGEEWPRTLEDASSVAVAARYLRICEGYAVAVPFVFQDYGSSGSRAWLDDAGA